MDYVDIYLLDLHPKFCMWQTAEQVMMYDIKISQSMHVQYICENPRAKLPHRIKRVTNIGCPTISKKYIV